MARVNTVQRGQSGFEVRLDDGSEVGALRLVLATGVRDTFPSIDRFEEFFGSDVFTCPSCDGYEAQGKSVAVIGDARHGAVALSSSRPISMRRISFVPAPISYSLASRRMRPAGYSLM